VRAAVLCVLVAAAAALPADKGREEQLLRKIETLKSEYARQQDILQEVTEARWSARQKQVKVKDLDNEETGRVRGQIERLYADIARAREELLSRQDAADDEEKDLESAREEWDVIVAAVRAKSEKASEHNLAGFPLDQDMRSPPAGRASSRNTALSSRSIVRRSAGVAVLAWLVARSCCRTVKRSTGRCSGSATVSPTPWTLTDGCSTFAPTRGRTRAATPGKRSVISR
jgi:hypothetical protein